MRFHPDPLGDLEHCIKPVRRRLVRSHDPEVTGLCVEPHHIAEKLAHHACCFADGAAGMRHLDGIIAIVRQLEFAFQQSAIGVRIGAHTPLAFWRQRLQFRPQTAGFVKECLGSITAHPSLKQCQMIGITARVWRSGLGARARNLRPSGHQLLSGRSSPWDCAARSSATPAAVQLRHLRAQSSESRECGQTPFPATSAISRCIVCGSSPSTKSGSWPYPRKRCLISSSPIRPRIVGLAIL